MRLHTVALLLLAICSCSVAFKKNAEYVPGCSSHCGVELDKDLTCWNKTLLYFEQIVIGLMRSYVSTQATIATLLKSSGKPVPSADDMVAHTIHSMGETTPLNIEDEDDLYSANDAKPVVEELVKRALVVTALSPSVASLPVVCPTPCEKSREPWLWLFLASLSVNLLLVGVATALMLFNTRRDERQAKRILNAHVNMACAQPLNTQKQK